MNEGIVPSTAASAYLEIFCVIASISNWSFQSKLIRKLTKTTINNFLLFYLTLFNLRSDKIHNIISRHNHIFINSLTIMI